MNFVEELKWRGMIHDIMPGTKEQFLKEITTAYIGFDLSAYRLMIYNILNCVFLFDVIFLDFK